jgi:hypothetical protein
MSTLKPFIGFGDPAAFLQRQTQLSIRRPSGTVQDSVRHSMIHTPSPDATIHHAVIAACPFPVQARADKGEYYMVAYVSIPPAWLKTLNKVIAETWDVQFIGPSGVIQKLPPFLLDMEDILGDRVYVGFDWLWLGGEPRVQPSADYIKDKLVKFVSAVREQAQR